MRRKSAPTLAFTAERPDRSILSRDQSDPPDGLPIQRRRAVPLTLEQWDRNTCSWPIGDPKTDDFKFCTEQSEPGRPYCTAHCAMAYTTSRDRDKVA